MALYWLDHFHTFCRIFSFTCCPDAEFPMVFRVSRTIFVALTK
uniref:Uncharacterized protein n=1 Tax=Anguilla anguilla TaxID=7936 RepID=A0A0E9S6M7_ANGAN